MSLLAATTRLLATVLLVASGLAALVGSTIIATNGNIDREQPPPEERPPVIIDVGADQAVRAGDFVQLEARAAGGATTLDAVRWSQLAGPPVALSDAAAVAPTLVTPPVTATTALRFEALGQSAAGNSGTDTVTIFVTPAATAQIPLGFEVRPDGTLPEPFAPVADDYAAECLRFTSFAADDASAGPAYRYLPAGNVVVWDPERRYNPAPGTPFEVTIDFITPVDRVSADVYAPPGESITLAAFDDQGAAIGRATSVVATACCELPTDTLSLAGRAGIHRVSFESSAPDAVSPIVDNLYFERSAACLPGDDPRQ